MSNPATTLRLIQINLTLTVVLLLTVLTICYQFNLQIERIRMVQSRVDAFGSNLLSELSAAYDKNVLLGVVDPSQKFAHAMGILFGQKK